jgi:hypothetical protein
MLTDDEHTNERVLPKIIWPGGKSFAFTIFDDPDLDTRENVQGIYSFLADLGLHTTKAIWPIMGSREPKIGGATCADERYLKEVLALQEKGFEIALHNVTYHTSIREETIRGLEVFRQLFGHDPYCMANHSGCLEAIYWGRARLSGKTQKIYDLLQMGLHRTGEKFEGHLVHSPLFWGDLCKKKIMYVRNFVFGGINTLKSCPQMPYYDPARPYVNTWFAASEGTNVDAFNALISAKNQEGLVREGGACIVYTHLSQGFFNRGKINAHFRMLMERLSRRNGWFVPVRTILDYIRERRGNYAISTLDRDDLEKRWLWHKIIHTWGRS